MNDLRGAARERLLDAALAELFGRAEAPSVHAAAARRAAMPVARWLGAAVVALAVGVVAASWWWARAGGGALPAQEPAQTPVPGPVTPGPVGPPVEIDSLERLAGLPDTVDHLRVCVPQRASLTAAHVGELARLRGLRALALIGVDLEDRAALARTLGALPRLSSLSLTIVRIDAAFFDALAALPLTELSLLACPGLDADAWRALARLRSLRSLAVTDQHGGTCRADGATRSLGTLGEPAFVAFEALPHLTALGLDESQFDDSFLERLPLRLERLDLGDRPMSSLAIAALQRLANLEDLTVHTATHYEAAVALLGKLRLVRLDFRGWLDDGVVEALGAHPTLADLTLRLRAPVDLHRLARAPKLREVLLRCDRGVSFDAVGGVLTSFPAGVKVHLTTQD